jgi:hypothetical protein
MKSIKHQGVKSTKTLEGARTIHGPGRSILWKWLDYQKQSIFQCKFHYNSNDILHRDRKSILKFIRNYERYLIAKAKLRKRQCCRFHNISLETILYTHSNKNSKVLPWKQTQRPMKQTTQKQTHTATAICFFDRRAQNMCWRKDVLFSGARNTEYPPVK